MQQLTKIVSMHRVASFAEITINKKAVADCHRKLKRVLHTWSWQMLRNCLTIEAIESLPEVAEVA